jgi:hypothetical protein
MAATEAKNEGVLQENEDATSVVNNLTSEDAKNQWSATTVLACLVKAIFSNLILFRV